MINLSNFTPSPCGRGWGRGYAQRFPTGRESQLVGKFTVTYPELTLYRGRGQMSGNAKQAA
ncbi:hypothetical protein [Alysiella filiformis]|uniref:hypothetical protein n=1 Tax=Alysiella filiformis TaxID=194196 RepID=UPI001177A85D|nr:hypothetical protein [Alysiella filiformis]QMT31949.1 hypothetical protein H3L97_03470 [Alysiella filiformis]UBQ57143.1 hypothetical protein JF568_05205 [Alysiella filiformis DSM 16848]